MSGRQLTFFVLGHRGMLGHLLRDYVERHGHRTMVSDHRYGGDPADPLIADVLQARPDVVVNCAGITTHRGVADASLFVANSILPQHLAAVLTPSQLLVHPSTDCVFDGRRGDYRIEETPNSVDPYGLSKRLGELVPESARENVVVLRTSMVGPELATNRGLLAWFLSQPGPVNGWRNHRWNGITTLAWAELCLGIAEGRSSLGPGVHQPATESVVTKLELLELFGRVFGHDVDINPMETEIAVDRSLRPTHVMPPIEDQLRELKRWMEPSAA